MKHLILQDLNKEITEFLELPEGQLKNLKAKNLRYRHIEYSNIKIEDNGDIYFSATTYALNKGKVWYMRVAKRVGFSIKNRKISIWYGNDMRAIDLYIESIMKAMDIYWWDKFMHSYLTKTLLQNILIGKVTSQLEYFTQYLKSARLNVAPRLFYKAVKDGSITCQKSVLVDMLRVAKNTQVAVEQLASRGLETYPHLQDMIEQAKVLDYKIDYSWSERRLREVHDQWTAELMALEMDMLDDQSIDYPESFYKIMPPGATLLSTKKQVFAEGKSMKHCIYTNYWDKIQRKSVICIHLDYDGNDSTLTFEYNSLSGFNLMQNLSKYNSKPAQSLIELGKLIENRLQRLFESDDSCRLEEIPEPAYSYIQQEQDALPF